MLFLALIMPRVLPPGVVVTGAAPGEEDELILRARIVQP